MHIEAEVNIKGYVNSGYYTGEIHTGEIRWVRVKHSISAPSRAAHRNKKKRENLLDLCWLITNKPHHCENPHILKAVTIVNIWMLLEVNLQLMKESKVSVFICLLKNTYFQCWWSILKHHMFCTLWNTITVHVKANTLMW